MRFLVLIFILCFGTANASGVAQVMQYYNAASSPTSCMSGTYILAWDGDYPSHTEYVCHTSGAVTITGTNTNLTVSSTYGDSSNGSLHDTADERMTWSQSGDQ